MSKREEFDVPMAKLVPVKEKLAYAVGFASKDAVNVVINTYIFVYLMEVVGINFAYIGSMMLATRIFDAINDPIIGQLADHNNSKSGKYKPFIKYGSIALAIVFAGLMFVPEIGSVGKTVWVTVFYVLWSLCFTIVEMPYFGILPAMTNDPEERGKITSWSRIAGRVPQILVPILIGALVNSMGDKPGYFVAAIIVSVVLIICGFIAANACTERAVVAKPDDGKQEKAGISSFLKIIKGNGGLLCIMLVQLCFTFNMILGDMLNVQYISHYLERPELSSYLIAPVTAGLIVGQLLVPKFQQLTGGGKRTISIGMAGYLCMLVICAFAGSVSIPFWVACMFALNMFGGALQIMIIMLCFDNADYIEYKTGERSDATIFSIVSFLMKLSAGFAATLAAFALGFAGFSMRGPEAGANIGMLSIIRYTVPGILVALAFLFLLLYPVKDSKMVEIRAELRKRHGNDGPSGAGEPGKPAGPPIGPKPTGK